MLFPRDERLVGYLILLLYLAGCETEERFSAGGVTLKVTDCTRLCTGPPMFGRHRKMFHPSVARDEGTAPDFAPTACIRRVLRATGRLWVVRWK